MPPPSISLVTEAHKTISKTIRPGEIAIDASCGNGYDTVFLAKKVGKTGKIYGFDIQQQALEKTKQKLEEQQLFSHVDLVHAGHEKMVEFIPIEHHQKISAIMFNLGYLPGGDKSIITQTETTLKALETACLLLKKSGIITVIAYPGHIGGLTELKALQHQISALDNLLFHYKVKQIDKNDLSKPQLFIISKL